MSNVTLINVMGDDLTIVNAARVSFNVESDGMTDKDKGLVRFLLKNRHMSPFEHVVFTFKVQVPIKIARHIMRHRWGSFNEMSTRYTEALPYFYTPTQGAVRTQVGKPGSYMTEPALEGVARDYLDELAIKQQIDWNFYIKWMNKGIAKELVAMELPMSTYTSFIWTINLRSLLNFLSLRNDSQAQEETQFIAALLETYVAEHTPTVYNAWIELGRRGEDE